MMKHLVPIGALVSLSACSLPQQWQAVHDSVVADRQKVDNERRAFSASLTNRNARIAAQDVAKPWLAGRARPLARELVLPEALQANIDTTLLFAGRADLPVLAERLTRATGIAVRVRPDALLPADLFLPRLAVQSPLTVPAATQVELYTGPRPLPSTLDALASRLGIYWRYHQDAIEFYRTQTRVFDVRSLTLSSRADVRLGRGNSEGSNGFENTSNASLSSGELNALQSVAARITPFLTRAGVIGDYSAGGSTLVITDTPAVLEQIAHFIDRENASLTRRIRLVFEEITVQAKESAEGGIDWSAVYASAQAAASLAVSSTISPGSGSLGVGLNQGPFQGSKAIVSALNEVRAVVRHSSVPIVTLNRRPVTHAVRTTFSYIDQVQSSSVAAVNTSGSAVGLPSVSISQKEETVGTFLTLVPDAQENGQILLSIAYDNTVAQPLKSITFGESGNQIQVQQITIDGNGTVQQVELRPGQTMIISGFERRQSEFDRRRLSAEAPLLAGGKDRAATQKTTTLVLVTAQIEESL